MIFEFDVEDEDDLWGSVVGQGDNVDEARIDALRKLMHDHWASGGSLGDMIFLTPHGEDSPVWRGWEDVLTTGDGPLAPDWPPRDRG